MKGVFDNQYIIFTIIGLFIFLFGLYKRNKRIKYEKTAIRINGEVEEIIYNRRYAYPLVSFDMQEGNTVAYQYNVGTYPAFFKKGDKVIVMYYKNNPKDFIIYSRSSKFVEFIFMIIGISIFVFFTYCIVNKITFPSLN